MANLKS